MKKFFLLLAATFYLFFILGFFLHTSSEHQIFGKYTLKYFLILLLFIVFPCTIYILNRFGKGRITLVLTLLIFLLALGSTEYYLRQKYKNFETNSYMFTLDNFDPFLQFKPTENYASPINTFGFRGKEIKKNKPDGTYRIVVLGGSTVLSRGNSFEKTAVRLLEKKLTKAYPDKKFEVINAGVDGYTSEHSLIQYLFKIKDFQPDMIIMWHGINDWYYSCSSTEKTYGDFKADYSHYLSANAQMAKEYFQPEPIVSIRLISFDFFIKFIKDNWYSDLFELYKNKQSFGGFYTEATKNKQYEMKDYPSLASYKRNVQSLIDTTKDDNVVLILGNQPVLYSDHMTQDELSHIIFPVINCTQNGKYPSIASAKTGLQAFSDTTKEIAEENDVSFVDLDKSVPKNLEYFIDDVHYTDKGNETVAETLYKFITTKNIIEN